jgi:hypothetical protein
VPTRRVDAFFVLAFFVAAFFVVVFFAMNIVLRLSGITVPRTSVIGSIDAVQ